MLVVKTLHIWMVISWFAGLFYLPRIFVNLAMVPADSQAERERLLLMAGKLFKFMTPLGFLAVVLGLWLCSVMALPAAGCMPRPPWSPSSLSITGIAAACCRPSGPVPMPSRMSGSASTTNCRSSYC